MTRFDTSAADPTVCSQHPTEDGEHAVVTIDRCVCKDIGFAELLEMTEVLGPDLDLICLSTGAGIECGTCRPWLARALAEGQARFRVARGDVTDWDGLRRHFSRRW